MIYWPQILPVDNVQRVFGNTELYLRFKTSHSDDVHKNDDQDLCKEVKDREPVELSADPGLPADALGANGQGQVGVIADCHTVRCLVILTSGDGDQ